MEIETDSLIVSKKTRPVSDLGREEEIKIGEGIEARERSN